MDLATNYLGLRLKNPIVAGASPMSRDVDRVRKMEDAGIAAVVLSSLFQEEIEHEFDAHQHFQEFGTHSFAEALSYAPILDYSPRRPHAYAQHLANLKAAVGVPIIASLNGTTSGGWVEYARWIEEAGADALELNVYMLATDPEQTAADVEDRYLGILHEVKQNVRVPVAMKLGPYFSSLPNFARRLDEAGVDGLVLFNRFYQPDIDLETLELIPDLTLSAPHEMRLPLRWIAILDPLLDCSLAATTGVYTAHDVLKLLMAGADAVMLVATLLKHGPETIVDILAGITEWMHVHEYESVRQLQGSMNHRSCANPDGIERANYIRALKSYV